jgi:hypothetical protein
MDPKILEAYRRIRSWHGGYPLPSLAKDALEGAKRELDWKRQLRAALTEAGVVLDDDGNVPWEEDHGTRDTFWRYTAPWGAQVRVNASLDTDYYLSDEELQDRRNGVLLDEQSMRRRHGVVTEWPARMVWEKPDRRGERSCFLPNDEGSVLRSLEARGVSRGVRNEWLQRSIRHNAQLARSEARQGRDDELWNIELCIVTPEGDEENVDWVSSYGPDIREAFDAAQDELARLLIRALERERDALFDPFEAM